MKVIGFFPSVELPYEGGAIDIRDFVIDNIDLNSDLEIALHSELHQLKLKFINVQILEDHGTSSSQPIGTWLLSISRAESFSLDTGNNTITFSLDFAAIPSWILSCSSALAIINTPHAGTRKGKY